jgi:hypothetical protein
LADENGCLYVEVSAKQNINIEELFNKIAEKFPVVVEVEETNVIDAKKFTKIDENKKRRCC